MHRNHSLNRVITILVAFTLLFILTFSVPPHSVGAQSADTPTPTPTDTPAASDTPSPAPTDTPTATDTPVASDTPTDTPIPLPTDTETPTPTPAPSETPTSTPTGTETPTPSPTPTLTPTPGSNNPLAEPRLSSVLNNLALAYGAGGSGGAAAAGQVAHANGFSLQKDNQNVQVVGMLMAGKTIYDGRQITATYSGVVEGSSGNLVQMSIPIGNLRGLAASGVFAGIRLPARFQTLGPARVGNFTDEGVSETGASNWQNAGITGLGVKVAILDLGFSGYTTLMGTDLPPSARLHVKSFRADGNINNDYYGAQNHGTQVAQIVYDMAPGVEMWLVNFSTDVEVAEAMDYLIAQHVQIINGSWGCINCGAADGSGGTIGDPVDDSIARAHAAGILYVASAGNSGGGGHQQETYVSYTTTFISGIPTPQDYHKWGGTDVFNEITNWSSCPSGYDCWVGPDLVWNDWGDMAPGKDYNLWVVTSNDGINWNVATDDFTGQPIASINYQREGYPWPEEYAGGYIPYYTPHVAIVVQKVNSSTDDYLELYTYGGNGSSGWQLQNQSSASTISSPADSPNAFSVGAATWFNWNSSPLEAYSSQGPVNGANGGVPSGGEAIKPDIVGPDCTTTSAYPTNTTNGFCGTSGAAPHVAGAAALVWAAFPGYTNDQVVNLLECRASGQAGAVAGCVPSGSQSNSTGWGKLALGTVPTGAAACTPGSAACLGATGWPQFQNAAERTGSSAQTVPTTSGLTWALSEGAAARPVVISPTDADFPYTHGLAYNIAGRYVRGIDPDLGQVIWQFDLGSTGAVAGNEAPAVTDYNNNLTVGTPGDDAMYLYVGSADGYVTKINAISGAQVCKSAKVGTNFGKASPTIGADGTVYLTDAASPQKLAALNPVDCSLKWSVSLGSGAGTSSPTYWANPTFSTVGDDLILVGADKEYAVSTWGTIAGSTFLRQAGETATVPTTAVVINPNNVWTAYAVNSVGDLYSFNVSNFAVTLSGNVANLAHASGSLAAYEYNNVNHYFRLYWGDGTKLAKWDTFVGGAPALSTLVTGSLTDSTPVVDNAGNVWIGAADGKVYGVNGTTLAALSGWPQMAGISTAAGLAISPYDGSLFVPSSDMNLRRYNLQPPPCASCVADNYDSDWPLFQQGTARQGLQNIAFFSSPSLLWQRNPGGAAFPPVVGDINNVGHPQGITYFVTGRYLRALDLDTRTVLWSYDLGVAGTPIGYGAPAVVDQNTVFSGHTSGIVYVGGKDGFLHAVDALTGALVWKVDVGADISKTSPVIGDDGTIYVVEYVSLYGSNLAAVTHLGGLRWKHGIGAGMGTSSPAYDAADGEVYVGGDKLYCFDATGANCAAWANGPYSLGASAKAGSTPLFDDVNSKVYILNNLGDLYSVDRTASPPTPPVNATLVYDTPTGTGMGSLALDPRGGVNYLYWTLYGKLYRWNITGATATAFTLSGTTTNSTPVVDAVGNVYVGTGTTNKLYHVARSDSGPAAAVIYTATSSLANAGAITHNPQYGVLLWPSALGGLYAFGTPEGDCAGCSLASTFWPSFQGNGGHAPAQQVGGGDKIRDSRQYSITATTMRPPVVDDTDANNKKFYFVSGQYLYARYVTTGAPVWTSGGVEKKYNLGVAVTAGVYGMPVLANFNGTRVILVGGSDGNLHAVDALTGNGLWKVDVGNNISKASPIVSDHGYILVVEDNVAPANDRLIALDSKGTILWANSIGNSSGTSSPAIDDSGTSVPSDDNVVVGGGVGLYAFHLTDGTALTGFPVTSIGLTNGSPTVLKYPVGGATDGYYIVNAAGNLYRVIYNGTSYLLDDTPGVGKSAAPLIVPNCWNYPTCASNTDYDYRIFFGTGNTLYRDVVGGFGPFSGLPHNAIVLGGDLGDSTPLVGDTNPATYGSIYVGSSDQKFYVVSGGVKSVNSTTDSIPALAYSTPTLAGGSMSGAGAFIDANTLLWPSQNGKIHMFVDGKGDSAASNTAGQWPLFQQDVQHTGKAGVPLPNVSTDAVEQWAVLGAGAAKPPVLGDLDQPKANGTYPDGVAYFVGGHFLYALDVRTHLIVKQWDLGSTSGVMGYASPAVVHLDPNGTSGDLTDDENRVIVADKNGVVSAYGANTLGNWVTSPFWSVDVGLNASNASPLAGKNNFVYVVEDAAVDRLHAINVNTGGIVWSKNIGAGTGKSTPAYYDGSTDYVIVGADKLYWFDAMTGVVDTSKTCTFAGTMVGTPMIVDVDGIPANNDEVVYVLASVSTTSTSLYSIPANTGCSGPQTPLATVTGGTGTTALAAYNYSGTNFYIYYALGNKLYRLDTNGNTVTNLALGSLTTNFMNSAPLVDSSGNVFVGGGDGKLYGVNGLTMAALTPAYNTMIDGNGWPKSIGTGTSTSSAAGALAMDNNGFLYVPSMDMNLRRFGTAAPTACADCKLYDDTAVPWPMFQHDIKHSGANTAGAGHRTPIVDWSRTVAAPIATPRTPVLGPPTNTYSEGLLIGTSGQKVVARNALNGNIVWQYDLGVAGTPSGGASPALMRVDKSGDDCVDLTTCSNDKVWVIVGAKDGFLYALDAYSSNPNGTLIWRIDLGLDISKASPAIGPDGTIYITEDAAVDRLHAVYWNGTRRWTQNLGAGTGASSPLLDLTNNRGFVGSATKIYGFDLTTGAIASGWPILIPTGAVNTTPILDANNNLWVVNSLGYLYRLNPAGGAQVPQLVYQPNVTTAVGDGVAPATQLDTYTGYTIIVFTGGTRFTWVLWNNIAKYWVHWRWESWPGTTGTSSPVIDANGWSYVLDSQGYLNAYYRYGPYLAPIVFRKKLTTMGTLTGGIIVGNNGMLYVPARSNNVYQLGAP